MQAFRRGLPLGSFAPLLAEYEASLWAKLRINSLFDLILGKAVP